MAEERTIVVERVDILAFEAARAGMTEKEWHEKFVNGHLNAIEPAFTADQASTEAASALVLQEKYTALTKEKQDQVDAILNASVEAPGAEEPVG